MTAQTETKRPLFALIGGALLFALVTGGLIVGINAIGIDNIRTGIQSAGVFAPLVYIGIKAATYVFAPLTSGPIQVGAGVLFGLWEGTIYTLIGEVLGGSIAFWISRRFGREIAGRMIGADGLRRADEFVNQIVDWKTLSYARLFLFPVYDFISYAVGFSRLPFRTYVIISVIVGAIPTFAAVALGTTLTGENSALIYVLVAVACAVPLIFQKRIRRLLKMEKT
ncbi:MAG: TVP38/TMEM64 family protein [Anaerolinea sp.]|nr:TVP38/TMEM64 family protein [Anaerolinea sp.]